MLYGLEGFRRARTDDWIYALGIVCNQLGLSLRDTSLVVEGFVAMSHEALRELYARVRGLFQVEAA